MNRCCLTDSNLSSDLPTSLVVSVGMAEPPSHMVLHRIDPQKNMRRLYVLSVQSNLFGGTSLKRSWGRIGPRGRLKVELFEDSVAAIQALDRLGRL